MGAGVGVAVGTGVGVAVGAGVGVAVGTGVGVAVGTGVGVAATPQATTNTDNMQPRPTVKKNFFIRDSFRLTTTSQQYRYRVGHHEEEGSVVCYTVGGHCRHLLLWLGRGCLLGRPRPNPVYHTNNPNATLPFDVQMNPYGGQGPDLQIKDGNLSFDIEVSRFRRNKGLERKLGEVELPEEIDSEASMLGKIKQKVKQLHEDKNGIILLKSDNTGIDWVELRRVFDQIPCGISPDPYLNPPKLCAVILSDSGGRQEYRINPRARMPADELRPVLSRIMKALNWVKEYTDAKLRVL